MARLGRSHDWRATSLGAPEEWPIALNNILAMMISSRQPMFLFWGHEYIQFYNDAYRPSLGEHGRHPQALGASGPSFWTDIWGTIGPQIEGVLSSGEGIWMEDVLIPIYRNGRMEDVYWTYSYSPARGDDGAILGVLVVCQETTARIASEIEVRRLADRLSTVLESITDAFMTLDTQWCFTFLNSAAERLLESSRGDLIGRVLWECFPEAAGSSFEVNYRHAVESSVEVRFESYYAPLHRWFQVTAYPSDEGLAIYFQDITQQRATEELLRHNKQLLEVAGRTARLGGWIMVVGSSNVLWSDEVCAIHEVPTGTSPTLHEAIGFYAEECRPVIIEHFTRCVEDGTPFDLDLKIITARGTPVWVQSIGTAIRDEQGHITRVQGAFQDISGRKSAEQALRESDRRWRETSLSLATTLNSIGDGVLTTDDRNLIVRMNPVAEQLTGWKSDEAVGQPVDRVVALTHSETRLGIPVCADIAPCETRAPGARYIDLLVRPDGTETPVLHSCVGMQGAQDQLSGAVIVLRDMSEELAAREETEAIQKQLILADRLASVGTLAAGVAHEVNNPLAYVMANLDLIGEEVEALGGGSSSARMRDLASLARDAREGTERIRKIVRGLKTFSRADEEQLGNLDITSILELSISMSLNEIRHRGKLIRELGEVPLVLGDDARLGQVFINLLVNAAQALPEGQQETSTIRVRTFTNPDGDAVIDVCDSGAGIPTAVASRIFDPFFSTKSVGVGTGLGLSICRNIVTAMGGSITVKSEEGRGTTFRVTLPRSPTVPVGPVTSIAPPGPMPKAVSGAQVRVLIIDDEPSVGAVLQRVLRGHDVTLATSAREALGFITAGRPFDVILSDLMMPEMSGAELYDILADQMPEAAEKMVFMTGGAFTEVMTEFLEEIENEQIEKPFDVRAVRRLVECFPSRKTQIST